MNFSLLKMAAAALALLATLSSTAHAVRVAGNGGDAVVLESGGTRFLDLVRQPTKVVIDIVDEGYLGRVNNIMDASYGYE